VAWSRTDAELAAEAVSTVRRKANTSKYQVKVNRRDNMQFQKGLRAGSGGARQAIKDSE